jgi:outer membrane biosynthesis protein TonB
LSYLLHDEDHAPARTNRVPFIVGGLILAAVAVFFYMRGGGKPAPATTPAAGDATASQTTPSDVADATPASTKSEPAKTEAAKPEPEKTEPERPEATADNVKTEPAKSETPLPAPVQGVHRPAPVAAKTHPKPVPHPVRLQPKPSPSKPRAEDTAADPNVTATPSDDCERQLPAMRKAAARGDAKAKADLGQAYLAGRCVPRDLPTSYHWYALALRTAPDSPQVSAQLEAIWKQMSPAERQLALKAQ